MMKRSSILKSERLKSASSDVLFIFAKIKTWQKSKRQVICWIENHFKKIDNYIEN